MRLKLRRRGADRPNLGVTRSDVKKALNALRKARIRAEFAAIAAISERHRLWMLLSEQEDRAARLALRMLCADEDGRALEAESARDEHVRLTQHVEEFREQALAAIVAAQRATEVHTGLWWEYDRTVRRLHDAFTSGRWREYELIVRRTQHTYGRSQGSQ